MTLDSVTLIVEIVLLDTLLCVLMLLHGKHRGAPRGFWLWTAAAAAGACAHGLLLLRLVLPTSASVLLACVAFCAGIQLRLDGTMRFCGSRGFPRTAYVAPLVMGGLMAWLLSLGASDAVRNTVTSLYVAAGELWFTYICFTAPGTGHALFRAAGVSQGVTAIALLARIGYWWTTPESRLLDQTSFQGYFFGLVALTEVCLATTFMLLNTARAESGGLLTHGGLHGTLARPEPSMADPELHGGLQSICSYCKSIRMGEHDWEAVELYVRRHSEADCSHGICPSCLTEHFPEVAQRVLDAPGPLEPSTGGRD